MVVFHVSTFILQLHTAGGYDYVLFGIERTALPQAR